MKVSHLLYSVAHFLVLVGALNWGLIGLTKVDAVKAIFGVFASSVYVAVGLAGLFMIALRFT
jgi:uncharacterized membrane protein YuzA (DUF378 family)